jgi:hypothetical protein
VVSNYLPDQGLPEEPPCQVGDGIAPTPEELRSSHALFAAAVVILAPVAVIGAALSFRSLYLAATPVFGPNMALGFPLLVDLLILGASLFYVSGAKVGHPRAGWRLLAHVGVATTLALNAYASINRPGDIPWHITAPAVWSVLVELTSREMLGRWRATHTRPTDRIPRRLWLTAPGESIRTSWRMARTGERSAAVARIDADRCAAARDALARVLPGPRNRRVRRQITRRLWAGSINPEDVLVAIGWATVGHDVVAQPDPDQVLRVALRAVTVAHVVQVDQLALGQTVAHDVAQLSHHTGQPALDHITSHTPETVAHSVAHGLAHEDDTAQPTTHTDTASASSPRRATRSCRALSSAPLTSAHDAVLAAMTPDTDYGMGEIVMATGRPRSSVKRAVGDLIASGRITSDGDPTRPRYQLTEPPSAVAQ